MMLQSFRTSCNLVPIIYRSTHHDGAEHSTIDYISVSNISMVTSSNQFYCHGISKHDVIFISLELPRPPQVVESIIRRNFDSFNCDRFSEDLRNINWQQLQYCTNVDDKVSFFTSEIYKLYDIHAPYVTIQPSNKTKRIKLTSEIRLLRRNRNKAWRIYSRSKLPEDKLVHFQK